MSSDLKLGSGIGFEYSDLNELPLPEYRIMYEVEDSFWWYVGMRNILVNLLERYWDWDKKPAPKVLDAGCGTGAILQRLSNGFGGRISTQNVTGLDLSQEALKYCKERGLDKKIVRGSITDLPFEDNAFDMLVSFDVLSYIPDPLPGFKEVSRVVKHGGLMIINLPAYQFLYSEHDVAVHTVRRFRKREVQNYLSECGLTPLRVSYLNTLLFPPAAAIRLAKRAVLKNRGGGEVHSDLTPPHPTLNKLLVGAMSNEASILKKTEFDLPFGLSLIAVARKM